MSCLRIRVLEIPAHLQSKSAWSSGVDLDTDSNTSVALSEKLEELSDLNKISRQESIPARLPSSAINDAVLGNVLNPNVDNYQNTPLRVVAFWGAEPLAQSYLYVMDNLGDQGYEIILLADDHWLQLSREKYLNTIFYGSFEYSRAKIETSWENHSYDDDTHRGFYFPVVNYGGLSKRSYISTRYFRPWFHILGILQKGFKEIGYKFESPILESKVGRQLIAYILREDFLAEVATERPMRSLLPYAANPVTDTYANLRKFKDNTIVKYGFQQGVDNPYMNIDTGKFSGCLYGDFSAQVVLEKTGEGVGELVTSELVVKHGNGQEETLAEASTELKEQGPFSGPTEMRMNVTNFQMDQGMEMYVRIKCSDKEVEVVISLAQFKIDKIIYPCIEEGQDVDISKMINTNDTLLDFLKGVSHLFEGKFQTDTDLRVVKMFTPYDVNYHGEDIEGYYSSSLSIEDLSDKLQHGSLKSKAPDIDTQKRFKSYQFQKSNDPYIEARTFITDEFPLYAVKIDLGQQYDEGVDKKINPYFSPTLSGLISPIVADTQNFFADNELPFCMDNENDIESYSLGKRIMYTPGLRVFFNEEEEKTKMSFFDAQTSSDYIPTGWQKSNYISSYATNGILSEHRIFVGYGDRFETDKRYTHYELFIRKYLENRSNNIKVSSLMFLDVNTYSRLNFRKPYMFHEGDYILVGYLIEYSDYQLCSDISTPMVFIPDKDTNLCEDQVVPPPLNFVGNPGVDVWTLDILQEGCCFNVNINFVGTGIEPTSDQAIEWIPIGGENWNVYNPLTGICDQTTDFIVRGHMSNMDDFADFTLVRSVAVCESTYNPHIVIEQTVENGQNCYELFVEGLTEDQLNTVLWTVKEDDVLVPYAGKKCGDFTKICAEAIVAVNCSCPAFVLEEKCIVFPPIVVDCSLNAPTLSCVDGSPGCKIPVRGGSLITEDVIDIIFWSCDDGATWNIWDEVEEICCASVRFKRWINFCGGICEPICVEVECQGIPFNPGTASNRSYCNDGDI